MNFLDSYSRYYDFFYSNKNYGAEARHLHGLIQKHCRTAKNILELGCGTGHHAMFLSRLGYRVHGVDKSLSMVKRARKTLRLFSGPKKMRPAFSQGDLRYLRLARKFDAVASLFHVMSYQATDRDLKAAFATAREHLRPGGVFVFDCWYGPAVLAHQPGTKVKRFEDRRLRITRISESILGAAKNAVDVHYELFVEDKKTKKLQTFHETHRMRYLFANEILDFFQKNGFETVHAREWLTSKKPGRNTWGVCFVGRLKK